MFIRGPNPIWFMNNLTGQPLDDTYWAFFLTNDLPYIPQAVFQDPDGLNAWSDPIEFQPSAGLPNNLYFDPALVYRIEVRQGPTQSDPLIWLIQNYTVGNGSGGGGSTAILIAENMITNPEFSDIFFVSPHIYNVAGTYNIAPGWNLVLTGVGTTTVTQGLNAGTNIQGNPPYYLQFSSSGWGSVKLIQTFSNNPAIFAGGAVAIAFTAASTGSPLPLTISYVPSDVLVNPTTLFTGNIPVGNLQPFSSAVNIPTSTSVDEGINSFVNIVYTLPVTGTLLLTNLQLTGQSVPLPTDYSQSLNPIFQEQTYERIVDHEFHWYKDSLITQSKHTLLTGWNFCLNPWQFTTTASTNVADNRYTADQTIIVQQNYVDTATGNNVAVGRGTAAQNYALAITPVTATNQVAIIQYIDPSIIRPYWNQILSSMANLFIATSHGTAVKFKVKLIYRNSLPPTISRTEPISAWTAASGATLTEPSFVAGWTALTAINDPVYTAGSSLAGFSFDQFQLPAATADAMTLGIVLYTVNQMNQNATADILLVNRVSLVQNDFAIDGATETFDETLRKCQFYYEKSYNLGVLPGALTYLGSNSELTNSATANAKFLSFYLQYKQQKRVINPNIVFYSPATGAINNISLRLRTDGSTSATAGTNPADIPSTTWNVSSFYSDNGTQVVSNDTHTVFATASVATHTEVVNEYHYVVDSRLGI